MMSQSRDDYNDDTLLDQTKNNKMKSGKRNTCRISDAPTEDHRKQNHCEIEKRRRDKMNHYITKLASMVPSCSSMPCRLDKLTVLRMAVQHIKSIRSSLCGFSSFHLRPSFLSSGNLLKNLILQMAAQEVQDNLFLVVSCDRGKVLFVSESCRDVLFYEQRELIGQSLFDILHKEDVAKVKEQISLSVSPKEMLVDSKTLQPLKGSRQAIHQSQSSTNGSTPQPGARRSFFCRIKTGHLRVPTAPSNKQNIEEMDQQRQDGENFRPSEHHHHHHHVLTHQREEEPQVNHKQQCQNDRHQTTHSERVSQSNSMDRGTLSDADKELIEKRNRQNILAPLPITCINNRNSKFSSGKGHAKYIVMRCTGYLKALTLRSDELTDINDMDGSASSDGLDEDENEGNCKSINCLVAVCRRVPVDKDLKTDRPMTFTCRYSVDGKFVFADQRTTVALGYLPQELLGTSLYEYCNPEHYKIVSDCHRQSLQKSEPVSSDVYQLRRKNGSYLWLQTRLKSFRNPWTKYIEFLIANHTTAEEVEPAHYSEGCVPTKFNQDLTAQSQSSSPSSSISLSTPSMDSSKKSSSPSSSSIGSSYSIDSWTQNGFFRMLNNSSAKIERAKVGQSIAKRVMDSYKKQADNRIIRSESIGPGSGSSGGNGTEDSSSYSDPPSCSSQSSQNSIASTELQMLSNYVESVNNASVTIRGLNTNNLDPIQTTTIPTITQDQSTNQNMHLSGDDQGTSSGYNTSSLSSGGTSSISGASASSSGAVSSGASSLRDGKARLTGKNKSAAGNTRHYHHHHHHHYHHHAQSCSRSNASSDTGIESGSCGSSESLLLTEALEGLVNTTTLSMPDYISPPIEERYDTMNVDSVSQLMPTEQIATQQQSTNLVMSQLSSPSYDCFMLPPLQPDSPNMNVAKTIQPSVPVLNHQASNAMVPMLPGPSSHEMNTNNESEQQPDTHYMTTSQHLPMLPLESNTDLNNIGASSLFEEIDDDVLLEYVANLDSDTEFSNLPIWHLSCGR